jgi:crotonobetainyl-CoA:carnitine CoA-transferase CaiB-like acyl-CoA transferase
MSQPLSGIKVLDFSTLLPGPLATLILAEAGAEVTKIERPGGEEMRSYTPKWGHDSANFAMLNRGKKSVVIDLKDPAQRVPLDTLIATADVVIEQFRPGVMSRLGLDYDNVSKLNPRIIYCSITGYGQSGPKRDVAGHDLNYVGDTGLLSLSMGSAHHPVVPPALIADIAGGAYPAVMNILMALMARMQTGKGCALDISMTDNLFPFMYWALGEGFAGGQWPENGDALVTGGGPRYRLYATKDERIMAVAPIEQKFWAIFCDVIGLEAPLRDDRINPRLTAARIAELIASKTSDEWRSRFEGKDHCCSIVMSLSEAIDDPHFLARGLFARKVSNEHGDVMPALPVPVAAPFRDEKLIHSAPSVGSNNAEFLS